MFYYFQKIAGLEPTTSCVRQGLDHCATGTQLTKKTVKFILIHASMIYQILRIR